MGSVRRRPCRCRGRGRADAPPPCTGIGVAPGSPIACPARTLANRVICPDERSPAPGDPPSTRISPARREFQQRWRDPSREVLRHAARAGARSSSPPARSGPLPGFAGPQARGRRPAGVLAAGTPASGSVMPAPRPGDRRLGRAVGRGAGDPLPRGSGELCPGVVRRPRVTDVVSGPFHPRPDRVTNGGTRREVYSRAVRAPSRVSRLRGRGLRFEEWRERSCATSSAPGWPWFSPVSSCA
jgi:hypothetical protein